MEVPQPIPSPAFPHLRFIEFSGVAMSPFLALPRVLTKPLRWPADSARRARHNAFAANAALAVRRAEREDVDQFLTSLERRGQAPADDVRLPEPRVGR